VALAGPATGEEAVFDEQERRRILSLSPLPEPPVDPSNRFSDDERAVAFGRKLFFDVRLSLDEDRSCATCHREEHGWRG
jgi:cytochrome c peroxidase